MTTTATTANPTRPAAMEIFQTELKWVRDEELREQVAGFIDKYAPDRFYVAPSSKTGRYHPAVSNGEGGLIRHTRMVARSAREIVRSYYSDKPSEPDAVHMDRFVSAALIHDMYKDGDPDRPGTGYKMHGRHVAERGAAALFNNDVQSIPEKWRQIFLMVATHMGPWTEDRNLRPRNIQNPEQRRHCEMFSMADYVASFQWDKWYLLMQTASNE